MENKPSHQHRIAKIGAEVLNFNFGNSNEHLC